MSAGEKPLNGSSESHWGTKDPAHQANHDELVGLQRLVAETWTRMGAGADPDKVLAELRERGVVTTRGEVERWCPKPG